MNRTAKNLVFIGKIEDLGEPKSRKNKPFRFSLGPETKQPNIYERSGQNDKNAVRAWSRLGQQRYSLIASRNFSLCIAVSWWLNPKARMTPQIDNVALAILKGACNPETKDLILDLDQLEIGTLAALLGEDVLKEIPVIKGVVACFKIPLAIRDQLFLRKVAGFLTACPRFTDAEKEGFIKENLSDDKKTQKLADSLVLILDRLDDTEKPEIIARMFAAFVRGKISFDVFRRLATAIDLGSVADLREFVKIEPTPTGQRVPLNPQTQLLRINLVRTGLVSLPSYTQTANISGVTFRENELGKTFREIMNDGQPPSANSTQSA